MVITLPQIEIFLFILARIIGLFISAPLISARSIPGFIRIGLAIWFTVVLWFSMPITYTAPENILAFIMVIMAELFIGYIIGFISNLIILSIQAAGDIADVQMGLSIANILSPTTGLMSSIIGSLTFYIALVIFLVINGHHMLFSALYKSFQSMPIGSMPNVTNQLFPLQVFGLINLFWISALRLAAPTVLMIFLTDFSFGLVSRVAPQVNVFMLGFQVKPSIGLIGILITLPLFARQVSDLIGSIGVEVGRMLLILTQ